MWWMLSPLSWLLLATCLACAAAWFRSKFALLVSISIMATATIAMTPLFANALLGWLETAPAPSQSCIRSEPDVAVVLAGGIERLPRDAHDTTVLSLASRQRIERALAWWKHDPRRRLVLSGGPILDGSIPEAVLLARYALERGVPAHAITVEGASRTTWENALFTARLGTVPQRVILVTTAKHMPRARYAMNYAGFKVCPLATASELTRMTLPGYLIPQAGAASKTQAGLHEVAGLFHYRLIGYREPRTPASP